MEAMSTQTVSPAASGDTLNLASSQADARAAEAVEEHHAEMAGALELKGQALVAAARANDAAALQAAKDALVSWSRRELVPHAQAEEETLYRAAATKDEAKLLVQAMLAEHAEIVALVEELEHAKDAVAALGATAALRRVFAIHLTKENEQILPLLVADPQTNVAELLEGMHEIIGGGEAHEESSEAPAHGGGHGSCSCGEVDEEGYPELDVQTIPHAIRHATLFGAIDALGAGGGLILRATHDPVPLLAQLAQRSPGVHQVDYLERGPEFWRLQVVRQG